MIGPICDVGAPPKVVLAEDACRVGMFGVGRFVGCGARRWPWMLEGSVRRNRGGSSRGVEGEAMKKDRGWWQQPVMVESIKHRVRRGDRVDVVMDAKQDGVKEAVV